MGTFLERHPSRAPSTHPGEPRGLPEAPMVLVHGLGGDRRTWAPVVHGLSSEHEVVVVELPGFGASPPLPAHVEPSPVALAEAVLDRLHAAGIRRFHLVGHSLGGWIVLEIADLAPDEALSVTALTPAGFWPLPLGERQGTTAIRVGRRTSPLLPVLFGLPFVRRAVLAGLLGGPGGFGYRDALEIVRGYVRASDYERVNAAMRRRVFDVAIRLAPLAARVPVCVVWAAEDRVVSPPAVRPPEGVSQHVIEGAGHLPTYDQPEQTVLILLAAVDEAGVLAEAR